MIATVRTTGCSVLMGLVVAIVPVIGNCADAPASQGSSGLQGKVDALIKQLDADTLKTRSRAERALLKLGPKILPLLPPPERLPHLSSREAVRRIRIRLQRAKARQSVLPARVTLKATLPLTDLLKAVSSQSQNRIELAGVPRDVREQTWKVDYQEQLFWAVMDDLVQRAKLQYRDVAGSEHLTLEMRHEQSQPDEIAVVHSGVFRVAVNSVELRPLHGAAGRDARLLRIRLSLTTEPRLRPLFLKFAAKRFMARSPAGDVLEPFVPDEAHPHDFGEGGGQLKFSLNYKVPKSVRLTYVVLQAKVPTKTAAGEEKITFRNLADAEGVARRRGGVTVTLQEVKFRQTNQQEHQARIGVAISYDVGGPAFESHRTWIFHNKAYLETKNGRRVEPAGGFKTNLQTDGAVAVEYHFKRLKRDPLEYRFVYVAPTLIIDVPVAFEFRKIPVPTSRGEK